MRFSTFLAFLPLVAAAPATQDNAHAVAPREESTLILGKFIVKLKPVAPIDLMGVINACLLPLHLNANQIFQTFGGFSAEMTAWQLGELILNPYVEYVEREVLFHTFALVNQSNAPWGLGRISNTQRGINVYNYDNSAGSGACAYVLDTGIDTSHPDLEGRASYLANFSNNTAQTGDPNGHGTHVSGIIAGKTFGVAKKARVFGVTVLNAGGDGTTSSILAGMDFVVADRPSRTASCPRGFVVNMSLGGPFSQAVNDAAANLARNGIFLATAAGNTASNANAVSPASSSSACTVGATDINDKFAAWSNFGGVVDILAPGASIQSLAPNSRIVTLSGTSQASPHIAGLAAYNLGLGTATTANMCSYLASRALQNVITSVPAGTVNLLAQNK